MAVRSLRKASRRLPVATPHEPVDVATPETIAVAFSRAENAAVFGAFAVAVLVAGATLLYRHDTD